MGQLQNSKNLYQRGLGHARRHFHFGEQFDGAILCQAVADLHQRGQGSRSVATAAKVLGKLVQAAALPSAVMWQGPPSGVGLHMPPAGEAGNSIYSAAQPSNGRANVAEPTFGSGLFPLFSGDLELQKQQEKEA